MGERQTIIAPGGKLRGPTFREDEEERLMAWQIRRIPIQNGMALSASVSQTVASMNFRRFQISALTRKWSHRVKLVLCSILALWMIGSLGAIWQTFHGEVVSGEKMRHLANSALGTDTGRTFYMGRSGGYDHFRLRWLIESKSYRVPLSESPIENPFPLRYWPGNWRDGVFGRSG